MTLDYKHEQDRIYALNTAGKLLAEIRFPEAEEGLVNFTSTFVDPSLRGQGIGDQLVRAAIADLREMGMKAAASCSYVKAWFEKHPEEADLLALND